MGEWKVLVVNKLIYVCGALVWSKNEGIDLEVEQNEIGRLLCDVVTQEINLIIGENG